MQIEDRARTNLSLSVYEHASRELNSWAVDLDVPADQYILRMPILTPDSNGFKIPEELKWIDRALSRAINGQFGIGKFHPFVYVTVRSGVVRSVSDDEWHVDGFSMRLPHAPEQNYIWSDSYGTEILDQQFKIPEDFDPFKHNLHQFFQDRATVAPTVLRTGHLYQIDPYIVHRRPSVPVGTVRTFLRISFVPIEIEDDTCTQNPLLPQRAPYNRTDIRKTLERY